MDTNFYDAPPMPSDDPAPSQALATSSTEIRVQNGNAGAIIVDVKRSMSEVRQRIQEAANHSGHTWEYKLPFKSKNADGQFVDVKGPTVKCALAVARCYGNCNVEIEPEIKETADAWYFNATITDLETGSRLVRPFRQRKNQNTGGKMDADRQLDMIFQIGASKAERNVVVNFLPDLIDEALHMARSSMVKKIEANPKKWIGGIRDWLSEADIPEERIARHFNRSVDDLRPAQIAEVAQAILAVKEGRASKAEFYADGTQDGTVVDMPAKDAKPVRESAKPDQSTGKKEETSPPPEKIWVKWRGAGKGKTKLLRDIKHAIKTASTGDELGALSREIDAAQEGAEGEAPKMWAEIAEALEAAWTKFGDEEKATDEADADPQHDPKTGEIIEPDNSAAPCAPANFFDE